VFVTVTGLQGTQQSTSSGKPACLGGQVNYSKGNEALVSQHFDREMKHIELSGVGEKGSYIIADWSLYIMCLQY
jgi:hypothetical protein